MEETYDLLGIPEEMKCLHGWLYWVGNKIPRTLKKNPRTGKCDHNEPACLASLNDVLERIAQFKCKHGLAFSFQREFGLTYIDLDNCRDPESGTISEFASDIVKKLASYSEISVGKKGLHVVVRGQVERPRMHTKVNWAGEQIEIKPFGFYMTVSGNHLAGMPRGIEDRQSELSEVYDMIFNVEAESPTRSERRKATSRKERRDRICLHVTTSFALILQRLA